MTEKEKREKAIEEMTTVLDEVDCRDHNICVEHRNTSCNRCCAERLSDYVLRKEEEVRKETEAKLKRLLLVLFNRKHNYYQSIDYYCVSEEVVKLDDIKDQFKKVFSVEVDE